VPTTATSAKGDVIVDVITASWHDEQQRRSLIGWASYECVTSYRYSCREALTLAEDENEDATA